jgi:hypothetical protein
MPGIQRAPMLALAMTASLVLCVPAPAVAAGIVGDANGDGGFDVGDVAYAMTSLRLDWRRPNPLADVALPCTGELEPADGQRLLGAWLAAADGISVRSRCNGRAIGTAIGRAPSPPALVTLDDQLAGITRAVPEFGGLFVEGDDLKVVLTQPTSTVLNRALDAIERVFGQARFEGLAPRAVRGDFSFSQLRGWKNSAMGCSGSEW